MNTLYYGDNLPILREYIKDESIDLVYLDPPFNSNRSYNVLFKEEGGKEAEAQITAFDDTWHWGPAAEKTYDALIHGSNMQVATMISAMRQFIGNNQMMAYLVMMAARLVELHRVLKPTGSIYLHCDPTASHYLKVVMDAVFGHFNFRNDIIWHRYSRPKGSQFDARRYGVATDNILFYSKSSSYHFYIERVLLPLDQQGIERRYNLHDDKGPFYSGPLLRSPSMGPRPNLVYEYKGFLPGPEGWRMTKDKLIELDKNDDLFWTANGIPRRKIRPDKPVEPLTNLWTDVLALGSQADERLGYPTQKPIALLERIIQASSDPGDVVLDPFSGCGTAIAASQKLGRQWIGIDVTHLAIAMHKSRLKDMFGLQPKKDYRVIGEPESLSGAFQLALDDRFQFQWWALSLVEARPLGGSDTAKTGKKGADQGIDGLIPFSDEGKKLKKVLVQVKSGHVTSKDIRDLRGVLERETDSPIAVLITLADPTRPMIEEAASAGFYQSLWYQRKYPRLQILTVEQLLAGQRVDMPPSYSAFKQAERVKEQGTQDSLGL